MNTKDSNEQHVNGQVLLAKSGRDEHQDNEGHKGDCEIDQKFGFLEGLEQLFICEDFLFGC